MGYNVESGSGRAVVIHTGAQDYSGAPVASIAGSRQLTRFDASVSGLTWPKIPSPAVMLPAVFLINGLRKRNWSGAFLLAMAEAAGLTPRDAHDCDRNLSKGVVAMACRKVIVRRPSAILDFGAVDVHCTEDNGAITEGRIVLARHLDVLGDPSEEVLKCIYWNSNHHTGPKNLLDAASSIRRNPMRSPGTATMSG